MKTWLPIAFMLVSFAIGSIAFAQQQQASPNGTFIPPKLKLPFPAPPAPQLRPFASAVLPKQCSVPLLEMKPRPSTDANIFKPRATQDPIESKPPAPACEPAAR